MLASKVFQCSYKCYRSIYYFFLKYQVSSTQIIFKSLAS